MEAPDEVGPDESIVYKMLGPLISAHTLYSMLLGMRIYTHVRPVRHLGWDDAPAASAIVATAVQLFTFIAAIPFGMGRHSIYVPTTTNSKPAKFSSSARSPGAGASRSARSALPLLMGLGVFAAAAEGVKLTLIQSYGQTGYIV